MVTTVIDVSTGSILLTADIHCIGFAQATVQRSADRLVQKLKQQIPALSAPVTRSAREIRVDWGTETQVVPGMKVLFLPNKGGHLDRWSDPRTWTGRWIEGVVADVDERSCRIRLPSRKALDQIQEADRAVLR